jgi:hypothetical protein
MNSPKSFTPPPCSSQRAGGRLLVMIAAAGALLVLLLCGCAVQRVQPWERDILAKPKMRFAPDALDSYFDEHIYFSKEGSSGGAGVGGGGCGCN